MNTIAAVAIARAHRFCFQDLQFPSLSRTTPLTSIPPGKQESPEAWYRDGGQLIARRLAGREAIKPARNVILFVGDGMSLATVAAARILEGQFARRGG